MPDRRGLLVDFGGVLTTSVAQSFRAFCDAHGLPRDLAREAFVEAYGGDQGGGPIHLVEVGELDPQEFAIQLAALLARRAGTPVEPEGLLDRLFAGVEADEAMMSAVAGARSRDVRTGLLSNSWGPQGYPRHRFEALFDTVVISGEVGLRKPDPAIFLLAAERLGLAPQACVFVDDLDRNVTAAQRLGMAGIVHRTATKTVPELARLLGLTEGDLGA